MSRHPVSTRRPGGASSARRRRGVSLIEALVAMAVMAFGMLGVVGLQATLRANADLSKQRSEATRIAQETIENWRNFSVLPTTAGAKAFADMASVTVPSVAGYTTNTTYTVTGVVAPAGAANHKTLVVDVSWTDRGGTAQNVRLFSAMAQIAPEFSATGVAPPQGAGGVREPGGRARGIPPQAKNFGDGTSGFRPPQGAGTVAWVFNNVSGLITSVCTTSAADNATITLASLSGCVTTQPYAFIGGSMRFALNATQPTALQVTDPQAFAPIAGIEAEVAQTAPATLIGTRACFHEVAAYYVQYFCAVPVVTPLLRWSGTLNVRPVTLPTLSGTLADLAAANRKVCRYRAAATVTETYLNVTVPLGNENLVVIRAGDGTTAFTCPSPPSFAHQPAT